MYMIIVSFSSGRITLLCSLTSPYPSLSLPLGQQRVVPRFLSLRTLTVIANFVQSGLVIWLSGALRHFGPHSGMPEVCDAHVTNLSVTVPAVSGIAFFTCELEHSIATFASLEVLLLCLGHGLSDTVHRT